MNIIMMYVGPVGCRQGNVEVRMLYHAKEECEACALPVEEDIANLSAVPDNVLLLSTIGDNSSIATANMPSTPLQALNNNSAVATANAPSTPSQALDNPLILVKSPAPTTPLSIPMPTVGASTILKGSHTISSSGADVDFDLNNDNDIDSNLNLNLDDNLEGLFQLDNEDGNDEDGNDEDGMSIVNDHVVDNLQAANLALLLKLPEIGSSSCAIMLAGSPTTSSTMEGANLTVTKPDLLAMMFAIGESGLGPSLGSESLQPASSDVAPNTPAIILHQDLPQPPLIPPPTAVEASVGPETPVRRPPPVQVQNTHLFLSPSSSSPASCSPSSQHCPSQHPPSFIQRCPSLI
ncbi:hypothetical protein JAAARDRAFT_199142 [Jaapia argillacea MUCL 33604]|uniref:Uncharacterized protein n=1 Tax=Jaapia argillacea MUCL 33604 TaxID=933084 RepID=A0A067PCF5_9AGAM|nr:hypothetical protein JAAARDRAFT_199142 [Jaapia argillacea MUCL 33604]